MKPCTILVRNKGRDAAVDTEAGTIMVATQLEITVTDDESGRVLINYTSLSCDGDTLTFPVFYDETKTGSITRTLKERQK